MKIINSIEKIISFKVDDKLITVFENGIISNLLFTNLKLKNAWKVLAKFSNYSYIIDKDQELFICKNGQIDSFNNDYFVLLRDEKKFLILNHKIDNSTIILDLHNCSLILHSKESVRGDLIENFIISGKIITDNSITVRNVFGGELILDFPLATLGTWQDGAIDKPFQVSEFSGIYDNTLVCSMNSGAVLLLNIEKGEVKQFFKDAKVRGGICQKGENSPLFLGLKHYTFIEINAETGQLLKQIDIQHELKKVANIPDESPCWLTVGTSIFKDGLFYFYGDKNFLGIFDPKTEKIIDHHWFEFEAKGTQLKGGIESLQVKDNEIYCLDTANTLYLLTR